jgi:hypothetical protein
MARPKKEAPDTRPHVLSFRASDEERATIFARAAQVGVPYSDYARCMSLSGRINTVQAPARLSIEAITELNRIGVNLNQLTRIANATGEMPARLPSTLDRINALLDEAMDLANIEDEDGDDPAVLTGE